MKADDSVRWIVSPGVRSTFAEDGAVLLDIKKGLCYSLNQVAARVWITLEESPGEISLADIVDVLETHFKISREDMERDTAECLNRLQSMGLVQRMRQAAPLRKISRKEWIRKTTQ